MKTLGVVGGIAPASTIEYYRTLIETYRTRVSDGSAPPILINSIDMQRMFTLIGIDALDDVTVYLSDEVEKLVRACPSQYLWGYNRYKIPAGAKPMPT